MINKDYFVMLQSNPTDMCRLDSWHYKNCVRQESLPAGHVPNRDGQCPVSGGYFIRWAYIWEGLY